MPTPIIPTDINGAERFNQFDPSLVANNGFVLKQIKRNDFSISSMATQFLQTQCTRAVEYWSDYPGDFEYPMPWMGTPHNFHSEEDMIIGKPTGYWRLIDRGKEIEIKLFNPVWGSKGQMIYYLDYIVPTSVNMYDSGYHKLLKDDGTVTGLVAANTRTRTGISSAVFALGINLFPHFDADYPVADVEKWDKYFKFDRATWAATIFPQTGDAGGYTDLWIWKGYDFKVPIPDDAFYEIGITEDQYQGIELNKTTELRFYGHSKWLGGYCKSTGFVLSSSNQTPTKGGVGCSFVEHSLNNLSTYEVRNIVFEGLTPNTTYYYRQYHIIYENDTETIKYSTVKSTTTLNQSLETYTVMSSPRMITSSTLSYNLILRHMGTKQIKEIGIVLGSTPNPVPNASGTSKRVTSIRKAFNEWWTKSPQIFVDYDYLTFDSLIANKKYYLRNYIIYQDDSIFYPRRDTNLISFDRDDYVAHPEWVALYTEATTSKAEQTVPKILFNCTFNVNQLDANNGAAYISARITDTGGSVVTARGVCYNTTGNPSATGSNNSTVITTDEAQERRDILATFYPTVTGLKANTKYYFRAFAINATGIGYSDGSYELGTGSAPVINNFITTTSPTLVKTTTALCGGTILNDGGSQIIAKGVVWSLNANPTVALTTKTSVAIVGKGIGIFESTMINLLPSKNYYVRAYFTNGTETKYGEQFSFRTSDVIIAPTITLLNAVVTTTDVTIGMNTDDDGGAAVVNKLAWAEKTSSTFTLPDLPTSGQIITLTPGEVLNNKTTIPITSFTGGKTYVFKGYADNGTLKSKTGQKEFFIPAAQVAPVAGTCTLSAKTNTSLSVSTAISALNNNTVVEHGILLRTTAITTKDAFDKKNTFGTSTSGMAAFVELTASTLYYVRSYLTYSTPAGDVTVLGTQNSFTTDATATEPTVNPTVTLSKTALVNNLGTFLIEKTGTISEKGIVYSTLSAPTIKDTRVPSSTYTPSIAFPEAKEYFVRAYVIQAVTGLAFYSNQINITVTNIINDNGFPLNPNIGQTVTIGTQTWKFNGEGWQKI